MQKKQQLIYQPMEQRAALFQKAEKLYHTKGREKQAIKAFEELLTSYPDHIEAWKLLATMQQATGDYDGCFASCDKALALAPDDPKLWDHKSLYLSAISRFHFQSPYYFDPDDPHCEGFIITRFPDQQAARNEYLVCVDKQLQLYPESEEKHPDLIREKAELLKKLERFDEAVALLLAAEPVFRNEDAWLFHPVGQNYFEIARLYECKADFAQAIAFYDRSLSESFEEIILKHKANAQEKNGEHTAAEETRAEYIRIITEQFKTKKDAAYLFQKVSFYRELGRLPEAYAALEELDKLENKKEYLISRIRETRAELDQQKNAG